MDEIKKESANGPEFTVLGGLFETFKLKEWELEFARDFIANPFTCNVIGNIKRYCSNILDDWIYYNKHHLDWINHLDTFLFWWSYTKSTDFKTFVCAVNFEQYDIADKCCNRPSKNFIWPRSKLSEIKDVDKYMSYINFDWIESDKDIDMLIQFPVNVTIVLLNQANRDVREGLKKYVRLEHLLDNNIAELIPHIIETPALVGFKKKYLQYADILIKNNIKFNYNVIEFKKLTDSEIETFLLVNKNLKISNIDIIYRVETIRRKMIQETKLEVEPYISCDSDSDE